MNEAGGGLPLEGLLDPAERPFSVGVTEEEAGWSVSLTRPDQASRTPVRMGALGVGILLVLSGLIAVPRLGDGALWLALAGVVALGVGVVLLDVASHVLTRDTAVRVSLERHQIRWTCAAGRTERWNLHGLERVWIARAWLGQSVGVSTHGGQVRALRLTRPDEARWLASVVGAWIQTHQVRPDPEAEAQLHTLHALASEPSRAGRTADPAVH